MRDSRLLISFILLAVVVLLNLPVPVASRVKSSARDNIAPFQNGLSLVLRSWSENVSALTRARELAVEKSEMSEEIVNLKHEIRQLSMLQKENDELRRQVDFQKKCKYELVLCEVISRGDTSGWWQTVTLNKGRSSGVVPDCAVITTEGLVGTTIRVGENTADVLLIVDYNCKVACKVERTGSLGILCGAGVSMLGDKRLEMLWPVKPPKMEYIDKNQPIQEGDRVVTSGLGGVYPEGLFVGLVSRIKIHPSDLYCSAGIDLAEDLDALRLVFVVKKKAQGKGK